MFKQFFLTAKAQRTQRKDMKIQIELEETYRNRFNEKIEVAFHYFNIFAYFATLRCM
jgi:hypothetical protein